MSIHTIKFTDRETLKFALIYPFLITLPALTPFFRGTCRFDAFLVAYWNHLFYALFFNYSRHLNPYDQLEIIRTHTSTLTVHHPIATHALCTPGGILNISGKFIPAGAFVHTRTEAIQAGLFASWFANVLGVIVVLVSVEALADIWSDTGALNTGWTTIRNADTVLVFVELEATLTHIRTNTTAIRTAITLGHAAGRKDRSRRITRDNAELITHFVFVNSDSNS